MIAPAPIEDAILPDLSGDWPALSGVGGDDRVAAAELASALGWSRSEVRVEIRQEFEVAPTKVGAWLWLTRLAAERADRAGEEGEEDRLLALAKGIEREEVRLLALEAAAPAPPPSRRG